MTTSSRTRPYKESEQLKKEDVMKKTLVTLMMLAATAFAETKEHAYFGVSAAPTATNTVRAERGYLACLTTENDGVMESALAHVAMMKLTGSDCTMLESRVAGVARTAASPEIRYKAFLTGKVLTNPDVFGSLAMGSYETPDELFGAIASRLGEYYAAR
jgi:hypothetical protein